MRPIQIGDVVGDYRVIDIAGSGGMGAVYKIEHVITKRIEAMKLLPPGSSSDPEQVQRFEREIQVQARLHHPNIVALYNAVRGGSMIGLVMEYVEGESLLRRLEGGALPVETAVNFAGQVLRALACAHEAGVIHRDVAPSNIIITPEGVVKLMDFGLARGATDLRLSTSGVPVGSPWYMSPEQVRAVGPMDARTDIYSTGALLYEMLTGAKLFEAEGAFAVMRAHVEATPTPPSLRNPEVPPALDEIVRKAVEKDPAMRFQTAAEFRLALQHAVEVGTANEVAIPAPVAAPIADPIAAPAAILEVPRRDWRKSFIGLTPRVRELVPSRAAIAVAMLPMALMAGLLRLVPVAHVQAPVSKPLTVAVKPEPLPEPPPVAVEPLPSPAIVEAPPPAEKPVELPKIRLQAPRPAPRRTGKPANFAIRVTGGEGDITTVAPVASPIPRETLEAHEPPAAANIGAPDVPAVIANTPPEPPPLPEAAPAKPAGAGNRFVRALGKVNPFRKGAKHDTADPAKTPLKTNDTVK